MPDIKGYRNLTEDDITRINIFKDLESLVLNKIRELYNHPDSDKRWTSIGKTHIQEGFMALNRAIAQPEEI